MSENGEPGEFFIQGVDGKDIFVHCWGRVREPRGVVQVFHGMAEHGGRYERFAQFLNGHGYIVYADDHRGHGKTAGRLEEIGYLGEDGFNKVVEDEHVITGRIKEQHPGLPVFLFAHSFGSFVGQEYITRYGSEISGVILSGSACKSGPEVAVGRTIAAMERKLFGDRRRSRLVDYLSFSRFNSRIEKPKQKFAWLSRDEEEGKKYMEDPFCGTVFTANFFYFFFMGLSALYRKEKIERIPKSLPVFICAGDGDPVGNYGKSVKKLYELYRKTGMKQVELKLYPDARHEILNETNRDEVFDDILHWIEKAV